MANKNARKILISLIIGGVVACISLNAFNSLQKEIKAKDQLIEVMRIRDKQLNTMQYHYLTATRDIEAGETVEKEDVKMVSFAEKQADALTSKEMVVGNVLLESVKKGQVFTGYLFTGMKEEVNNPKVLKEGFRALTLATSALDGLSDEMKAGSFVDVFSKSKSDPVVFSKIKILSLEPADEKSTDKDISIKKAKTATFEVSINKIQEFVEMYSSGKILLVMRPVGDDTVVVVKKKKTSDSSSRQSSHNYNYDSNIIPPLPVQQTYEDPTINELPAPVVSKSLSQTVEIIEASNKTQVSFE